MISGMTSIMITIDHPNRSMDQTHLSIKEAADRYQRAEITIRRLVRSIVKKSQSKDRLLIQPLPAEALKLKNKRKPFSYSLSAALLEKHFGAAKPHAASSSGKTSHGSDYIRLLEETNMKFQEQLSVKDDQIRAMQQSVESLAERQREMNILMKGLQQQLLLTSGQDPAAMSKRRRWWQWGKRGV